MELRGPWPRIELGLAEPQSAVLTPTPPQPRVASRHERGISTIRPPTFIQFLACSESVNPYAQVCSLLWVRYAKWSKASTLGSNSTWIITNGTI